MPDLRSLERPAQQAQIDAAASTQCLLQLTWWLIGMTAAILLLTAAVAARTFGWA